MLPVIVAFMACTMFHMLVHVHVRCCLLRMCGFAGPVPQVLWGPGVAVCQDAVYMAIPDASQEFHLCRDCN